ncbi:MAG: TRAP transporter small permease [Elusimicrobiota bacterium]|jgi:TRAP-type C4-dicarboxylate transport system permease small subunit|nr:TRAP transporter small permease [Elusimicrobiota bacterium]
MLLLKKLDAAIKAFLRVFSITLFTVLGILLLISVSMRLAGDLEVFLSMRGFQDIADFIKSAVPMNSFHWFDEIVELLISALAFFGAAALWTIKGHFAVGDWISSRLPGNVSRVVYKTIVALISVIFMAAFLFYSVKLCLQTTELSTVFQIPKWVMYGSMPISAIIMLSYSIADLIRGLKTFK